MDAEETPKPADPQPKPAVDDPKTAVDDPGPTIKDDPGPIIKDDPGPTIKDDPGPIIKDISEIVKKLIKIFPAQTQPAEGVLKKYKSYAPTTSADPMTDDVNNSTLQNTISLPPDFPKLEEPKDTIEKLQRNLTMLQRDVEKVKELNEDVAAEVSRQFNPLKKLLTKVEEASTTQLTKGMKKDLEDINKKIFTLMCEVPLLPNKRRKPGGLDIDEGGDNNGIGIVCLPGIHANEEYLKQRAVYKDVRGKFKALKPYDWKICLLSLAVFPENQEVNRTMLMYWWLGEGILPDYKTPEECDELADDNVKPKKGSHHDKNRREKDKPEDVAKAVLDYFKEKKLIEAVENKRKVEPNSYKMTPFVHAALVLISKEMELFDIYHEGDKKPTMNKSTFKKVCLVEGSSSQKEAKANKMDAEDIETVFNVSERFPDFTFKWFSFEQSSRNRKFGGLSKITNIAYNNLKVYYLGRWERTAKRHIEVENPELMKNLKYMKKLRLLSFQGISRIERLDDAVCKLHELIILDLRACYNLEKLPDKLDSLTKLIYLDITDCYMIDRMPKRISWLGNLEVLKGFVVSDASDDETVCTLAELTKLTNLRKLSITINKGKLTVVELFWAIEEFKKLEKLKVAWGWINEHDKPTTASGTVQRLFDRAATFLRINDGATDTEPQKSQKSQKPSESPPKPLPNLPVSLKKLDLQCLPGAELPDWLQPNRLLQLEKLYIKGGTELTGFGEVPDVPTACNVKVLRLKFLPRLKVEWRDLRETYFPNLTFLEKYQCPQVSLCPCDGIGIWRIPKV